MSPTNQESGFSPEELEGSHYSAQAPIFFILSKKKKNESPTKYKMYV